MIATNNIPSIFSDLEKRFNEITACALTSFDVHFDFLLKESRENQEIVFAEIEAKHYSGIKKIFKVGSRC